MLITKNLGRKEELSILQRLEKENLQLQLYRQQLINKKLKCQNCEEFQGCGYCLTSDDKVRLEDSISALERKYR